MLDVRGLRRCAHIGRSIVIMWRWIWGLWGKPYILEAIVTPTGSRPVRGDNARPHQQVAAGKLKPVADVVARLRAKPVA